MPATPHRPTVCLNMIVKNESRVIQRCLSSLRHIIDYWVIVDTGSTDGTQEIIKDFLKDIPGELFERPWKNFGYNRTEALQLAKGKADYLFIIDADEIIRLAPDFSWNKLYHDSYIVQFTDNGISYVRCQIVNNHFEWSYKGVLHEYIESKEAKTQALYPGLTIIRYLDGSRSSDPQKFKKDALVLEQALLEEPDNDRYLFYLAQSYRDCGDLAQALRFYQKRVEKGGWDQEVWYSLYQIAQLMERANEPWPKVMEAYLEAFQYRPNRVGPLYRILRYYVNEKKQYHLGYLFGKTAIDMTIPQEALFVEQAIYDYYLPLEYGVCAFYVGNDVEAIKANNRILQNNNLSGDIFMRALTNRLFSLDRKYPKLQTPQTKQRKIRVVIPFHNPGHFLDNCIERLSQQQYKNVQWIFLNNASADDSGSKVPKDLDHVDYIHLKKRKPLGAWMSESLKGYCQKDDLVLFINGDDWLEADDTLGLINQYFNERDCQFLLGQFRFSDGRYGKTMPFLDVEALDTTLFYPLTFAFSGELLLEAKLDDTLQNEPGKWLAGNAAIDALAKSLIKQAGADKAHFNDQVLMVYNLNRFSDLIYPGTEKWLQKPEKMRTLSVQQ
ncbi:MAG: glycosyltransferase [Saprospiraceae bacterium]|nr:glycosyltransferase [Saprospiraceae bacterium]